MTLQVDFFSGLEPLQFSTQYERSSLPALQGNVQSSLTLFITLKATHRLGIVVYCHGIVKKYSLLVFVVVIEERMRKGKRKFLRYIQIIFKAFGHFFNLLIFKIKLFTESLRFLKVIPKLTFSLLYAGFDSLLDVLGRKPPECEEVMTWSQSCGPRMYSRVLSCFCISLLKRSTALNIMRIA